MSSGYVHRTTAAIVIGGSLLVIESSEKEKTFKPLIGAGLATYCTGLPDIIEPATNPNHRQFFHSLTFASALGYGGYRLYKWRPDTKEKKWIRWIGLVAISSYFVHLALDASTPKSLPLLGKL